jgi:hypothetical protein
MKYHTKLSPKAIYGDTKKNGREDVGGEGKKAARPLVPPTARNHLVSQSPNTAMGSGVPILDALV